MIPKYLIKNIYLSSQPNIIEIWKISNKFKNFHMKQIYYLKYEKFQINLKIFTWSRYIIEIWKISNKFKIFNMNSKV